MTVPVNWTRCCGVVGVLFAVGCAPRATYDPLSVIADRSASRDDVERAIVLAGAKRADERWARTMSETAWRRRVPAWLRTRAMAELLDHDQHAFRAALRRRLDRIDDWQVLRYACDLIAQHRWQPMTTALIRSYVRPSRRVVDADRPERAALERLHPGTPIRDVLSGYVTDPQADARDHERACAWELYARLFGKAEARRLIEASPHGVQMAADLRAALDEAGLIPTDRYGVAWLSALRADRSAGGAWARAIKLAGGLTPEQRAGFATRHLPVLAELSAADVDTTRERLAADLAAQLRGRPAYHREDLTAWPAHGYHPDHDVQQVVGKMSWGDLLVVRRLMRGLNDPDLRAALFAQADADHLDRSTEHGGVLEDRKGRLAARAYPPMVRRHDRRFYASPEMIRAMYHAVAHYHFHAQEHANRRFAGPGLGDVKFTDRIGASCVVLTWIDRDRMNVDYYQPGGIVLDLGVIARPR